MPRVYVAIGQESSGPHTLQHLQQMVRNASLTATTLVWQTGMPNWQAAGEVAALNNLFAAQTPPPVPPPIPPQST